MQGLHPPPGGGAGGRVCLQRPPARASRRLWGIRQHPCVSSLNLARPPGCAVLLASGLSVVCGRCSLSACQARSGLQAELRPLGSPALPSRRPGWAGVRRDPGSGSCSRPLLGGAGCLVGPGRPAAEAVCPCLRRGLAACGPPCGVVHHWSGEGAEVEGQAAGPCAAPARPCRELCAGGRAAPSRGPRVPSGGFRAWRCPACPRGLRISSAGYWVPARLRLGACGSYPARTGGFTPPVPGAPPSLGARLGLSDSGRNRVCP